MHRTTGNLGTDYYNIFDIYNIMRYMTQCLFVMFVVSVLLIGAHAKLEQKADSAGHFSGDCS